MRTHEPTKTETAYVLPTGHPVRDWRDLDAGDEIQVRTESGSLHDARVDTVSPDGTMLWFTAHGAGNRTLHLHTDPLTLYRT